MISARPVSLITSVTLLGTLQGQPPAQEKAGEELITALIEQLGQETSRDQAIAELLQLGSRPTELLVRSLRRTPPGPPPSAELQRAILAVLIEMGKDAGGGVMELGASLDDLPEELGPLGLRAFGELAFWGVDQTDNPGPFWSPVAPCVTQVILTEGQARISFVVRGDRELLDESSRTAYRMRAPRQSTPLQVRSMLLSDSLPEMELGLEHWAEVGTADPGSLERIDSIVEGDSVEGSSFASLVRFKAARAMVAVAPGDPRSSRSHGYLAVHHHDPVIRSRSALAAANVATQSSECVPFLVEALRDDYDVVVREVITALGMIGPAAGAAVPALETLTEHGDRQIAERAKVALRQIRGLLQRRRPLRLDPVREPARAGAGHPVPSPNS